MPVKLTMGKGAVCTCKSRFIHPLLPVKQFHGVATLDKHLMIPELVIDREGVKKIHRKDQKVYIFHHRDIVDDDGTMIDLYAAVRNLRIQSEGPAELFFNAPPVVGRAEAQAAREAPFTGPTLPREVQNFNFAEDSLLYLVGNGVSVDDDRMPVVENRFLDNNTPNVFGDWGFDGFCYRKSKGYHQTNAHLTSIPSDSLPYTSLEKYFEVLFPASLSTLLFCQQLTDTYEIQN